MGLSLNYSPMIFDIFVYFNIKVALSNYFILSTVFILLVISKITWHLNCSNGLYTISVNADNIGELVP